MAGPRRPIGRRTALALIGALGAVLSARSAEAGCHVADPPRSLTILIGRLDPTTTGPIVLDRLDEAGRSPQVAPKPCRDETPAVSSPIAPPASVATLGFRRLAPAESGRSLPLPASPAPPATEGPGRLDRPPRRPFLG